MENPSHAPVDETPANGTYCVTTAMDDVVERLGKDHLQLFHDALGQFSRAIAIDESLISVPDWNAHHTTEEVLEVWDRAIAALEAEAA